VTGCARRARRDVFLLVVAGHETTVNLIGNGVLALLHSPDQLDRLRSYPRLDATAIDELLRFHSPIEVSTERYATRGDRARGCHDPKGGHWSTV
jgi:cytochrome P450